MHSSGDMQLMRKLLLPRCGAFADRPPGQTAGKEPPTTATAERDEP